MKPFPLSHIRTQLGLTTLLLGTIAGCGGHGATSTKTSTHEFAYVTTFGLTYQYSIDPTGQLTPLSPSVVSTPSSAGIVVSKDNKFAYITNEADDSISQFSINPNGTLASLGADVPCGTRPESVVITPDNKFLFVANDLDNTIGEFSVGSDGRLTPLATAIIATPHDPFRLGISPDGKYVYAACYTASKLAGYSVGTDGQLAPLAVPTYDVLGPYSATFSPDGTRLLVPGTGSYFTSFVVQPDGSLPSYLQVGTAAPQPIGVCITPDSKYVYASCYNGGSAGSAVNQYSYLNGFLQPLTPASVPGAVGSYTDAVDPSSKFLYVLNVTIGSVSEYSIGPDGGVTLNGSVSAPQAFHIAFAKK